MLLLCIDIDIDIDINIDSVYIDLPNCGSEDNVVIDEAHHALLTDFGLSKDLLRGSAFFCSFFCSVQHLGQLSQQVRVEF